MKIAAAIGPNDLMLNPILLSINARDKARTKPTTTESAVPSFPPNFRPIVNLATGMKMNKNIEEIKPVMVSRIEIRDVEVTKWSEKGIQEVLLHESCSAYGV
jgi:hypothetical protein